MPMGTKQFPGTVATRGAASKSMRKAFGKKEEDETPQSTGHTKLDEEQDSFSTKISKSLKRKMGR